MLTAAMPADAVQTALKRVSLAAEDLDGNRVAALTRELAAEWGVPALWEQVCRPLLERSSGRGAAEIAVEHALSEGVRIGLDVYRREPGRSLPVGGVLLAEWGATACFLTNAVSYIAVIVALAAMRDLPVRVAPRLGRVPAIGEHDAAIRAEFAAGGRDAAA